MAEFVESDNIFKNIPEDLSGELIQTITESRDVRFERIVSRGHSSPPGYWYDQEQNEFVLLIRGKAGMTIAGQKETIILRRGDYLNIPAHRKHRVEWTDREQDTIWLAIHY